MSSQIAVHPEIRLPTPHICASVNAASVQAVSKKALGGKMAQVSRRLEDTKGPRVEQCTSVKGLAVLDGTITEEAHPHKACPTFSFTRVLLAVSLQAERAECPGHAGRMCGGSMHPCSPYEILLKLSASS